MDASNLNRVANDPAVHPGLGVVGTVDLSPALANPINVALENEHGGFLFLNVGDGRYELHTMFRPEGRGRAALDAAAEAFRFMFIETPALELLTKTAHSNPAAALMARRAGFTPSFVREAAWVDGGALTYYSLTLDRWVAQDPAVAQEGAAFHAMIEGAKQRCGSELATHPDDEAHDRAAGAASLMARAGSVRKAVWAYSRWARFAGYQTIELMSDIPPVIDVRDALIGVRDGKLEVLKCLGQQPQR